MDTLSAVRQFLGDKVRDLNAILMLKAPIDSAELVTLPKTLSFFLLDSAGDGSWLIELEPLPGGGCKRFIQSTWIAGHATILSVHTEEKDRVPNVCMSS